VAPAPRTAAHRPTATVGEQVLDSAGGVTRTTIPGMVTTLLVFVAVFFLGMGMLGLIAPVALIRLYATNLGERVRIRDVK
jgi:hypothetical protein